jgi:hypothetical protein
MRIPLTAAPANTRRSNAASTIWCLVGIIVLCADALAIRLFCQTPLEVVLLAALTLPLGALTIIAAIGSRK